MSDATTVRLPSERKFGFTFTIFLSVVAICAALRNWGWVWCVVAISASAIIGSITLATPATLAPLNKAWFYLGQQLGKVVSPIVLGIIFFGLLTPLSAVARLCGRDELRLRRRPGCSYWINRSQPRPTADSFKNPY